MFRRLADLQSWNPERGATAVEYALMVGFIAAVIVVGVTASGESVNGLLELVRANPPFK